MTTETTTSGYSHTQKASLCLLIYALAVVFFASSYFVQDAPLIPWLFPPIGVLMLILAASIHHLTVEDQGDVLAIRFGPLPLLRRTVRYADIRSVEVGRTLLLDGWGIHNEHSGRLGVEPVGPDVRGRPIQERQHAADRDGRRRESVLGSWKVRSAVEVSQMFLANGPIGPTTTSTP